MSVEPIQMSYARLCESSQESAWANYKAFFDTLQLYGSEMPPDELMQLQSDSSETEQFTATAHKAIENVRHGSTTYGSRPYFRGSGAIVVGREDGRIMAVDYRQNGLGVDQPGDPVADHYGYYQYRALQKAGLAMAIARSRLVSSNTFFVGRSHYDDVDRRLKQAGVPNKYGHRLGYALRFLKDDGVMVAGASGMLASQEVTVDMEKQYRQRLERDDGKSLAWSGGAFLGLHNMVAVESVAHQVTSAPSVRLGALLIHLPVSDFPKANLHE